MVKSPIGRTLNRGYHWKAEVQLMATGIFVEVLSNGTHNAYFSSDKCLLLLTNCDAPGSASATNLGYAVLPGDQPSHRMAVSEMAAFPTFKGRCRWHCVYVAIDIV